MLFPDCAAVGSVLFRALLMYIKNHRNLYSSSKLQYLPFSIDITFISLWFGNWEISSLFDDAFMLLELWIILYPTSS